MSELQLTFLVSFFAGLFILVLVYFLQAKSFSKTGNTKYNLLRYFPFELNRYRRNQKWSVFYPICVLFGTLFISTSILLFAIETQQSGGAATIPYIMFGLSLIAAFIFNGLTFIKLSNYQLHLIFAVIFVCLNILQIFLNFFFLTNGNYFFVNAPRQPIQITVFIICFLILIFEVVLMFNPSYKRWNKMVKVDAETFNRPRFNYLAMLEWGNFIVYVLNIVPIGIMMFF